MWQFFLKLFDTSDFPERWHCGNWSEGLGWLHILSDVAVFGAYFAIPISLALYVRTKRREVVFPRLYWLFALFILSCGLTHLTDATIFWHPWYRFFGVMKAITGVVSWATVITMIKVMPQAMTLPGAARLNVELSREIEERKRSESALRESSAQLLLAMEHADLGDWRWSADECTFSERAAKILGVSATTRPPWNLLRTLIYPDDRERTLSMGVPAKGNEAAVDREFRITRPSDGYVTWVQVRGRIAFENGRAVHARGIVQDVSARKGLDAERDRLLTSESRARADAERANNMKDEFLATLSHELRTPLTAILSWCHILRTEPPSADQYDMGLEIIDRNSKVQVQLIEDLLDMSRIVSGKIRLDVQPVDLSSIVKAAIETVLPSAMEKEIKLNSVLDPLAGPVRGDPARLQQVVWNLLANAIKFTPKGGRVSVALERVNSHVEITVSDNGMGIAPEILPFIFDRFLQADASMGRRHGGLGLGLSIAKNLTELHGGTISAKSPGRGQGATFRMHLPLPVAHQSHEAEGARVHPRASMPVPSAETSDLSGLDILAVDDEPDALEALKRLLQFRGAAVSIVSSAAEALDALQRDHFHVLISDVGMPEVNGFDLISKVRALEGGARHIPAIALTAFARSEDRRRAMTAGFDTYLSKPVDPAELFAVVARQATRSKGGA